MIRAITVACLLSLMVLAGCSSSDPTPPKADAGKTEDVNKTPATTPEASKKPGDVPQMLAAKVAAAKAVTRTMWSATQVFRMNTGRYPSEEEGLDALIAKPENVRVWTGPYIADWKTIPKDPWGGYYGYAVTADENGDEATQVFSLGADGQPGGAGACADIINGQIVEK